MTQATLPSGIDLSGLERSHLEVQDTDVLTCMLMSVLDEPPTTYRGFDNTCGGPAKKSSLREHS
ncbi:hypothetical protein [Actinocorallia longicatena]|uniref:FXSXX-COOH protein n=1 Tax=Actinocorallia longicatena TaxID=111803 RepID=A0ABP6Q2P7_9ACTN